LKVSTRGRSSAGTAPVQAKAVSRKARVSGRLKMRGAIGNRGDIAARLLSRKRSLGGRSKAVRMGGILPCWRAAVNQTPGRNTKPQRARRGAETWSSAPLRALCGEVCPEARLRLAGRPGPLPRPRRTGDDVGRLLALLRRHDRADFPDEAVVVQAQVIGVWVASDLERDVPGAVRVHAGESRLVRPRGDLPAAARHLLQ